MDKDGLNIFPILAGGDMTEGTSKVTWVEEFVFEDSGGVVW